MPLTKAQSPAQGPPAEVKGDMKTDDKLPTKEELKKLGELEVFDVESKAHKFSSLLQQDDGTPRRTLVIFIRHFFCGNCQEYTSIVSSHIPPSTLSSLSEPTSIIIIGCGNPILIQNYIDMTSCPYPIYADPTTRLYKILRLGRTLNLGNKTPQYMQHTSIPRLALRSIWQELRSGKNLFRGGDYSQVGGEFLFEPSDAIQGSKAVPKVTWCKRMKNTRDHAEISELKKVIGMIAVEDTKKPANQVNGEAPAPALKKRWSVTAATSDLGRRLSKSGSKKRTSWHAGAGKQPSTDLARAKSPSDKEAEQERQVLEQLKEDNELEGEGGGTDDAFDRLTRKPNGTVTEPHANGVPVEEKVDAATHKKPTVEEKINGHATQEKAFEPSATMPEPKLNGHATEGKSESTPNGTASEDKLNGHIVKSDRESVLNGAVPRESTNGHIKAAPPNDNSGNTGLWSKIEKTANGAAINGSANGHITA